MNKFYVISIKDAANIAHSYGIVATSMAAAVAEAQTLAGVSNSVDPDTTQVLYPKVDSIVGQ